MSEGARTLFVKVTGRVQGVGFRAFAREEATRRGLTGWVVNRDDGSVEAAVHGPGGALAEWVGLLRKGPPAATVQALDVRSGEPRLVEDRPADAHAF